MWTFHFDTASELIWSKDLQKEADEEEKEFQRKIASISSGSNEETEELVAYTQVSSYEAK